MQCHDRVWRYDPPWNIVDQSPVAQVNAGDADYHVYCQEVAPLLRGYWHGINYCFQAWDVFGTYTGWICQTPYNGYVYVQ